RIDERHVPQQQAGGRHRALEEGRSSAGRSDDLASRAHMKLAAGAFSDAGRVRDNNEDAHLVDDRLALFAIADGMGGHVGGEVASWTAIEALRAAVANGRAINDAIEQANEAVLERATQDPDLTGMGTTMTAVTVAGGRRLLIGHVGDSRAY